jgi:tetratricopeptide (TPR) repeat protein
LAQIERRLKKTPRAIDDLFLRAQLLEWLGRNDDAREAYFALLTVAPTHFGGLNNLGNVLTRAGKRRAAQAAYEEAVRQHPRNAMGRASLGICLLELEQFDEARTQFEAAVQLDPKNSGAHKGLSYLYSRLGDEVEADVHRRLGFGAQPLEPLAYTGDGEPVRALVLVSATGGNLDAESLFDKRTFAVTKLYVEFYEERGGLPRHDIVFNAASDADVAQEALHTVPRLLAGSGSTAPLINPPEAILPTGRMENARRLGRLEGVIAPKMELLSRAELEKEGAAGIEARGFRFPLLLRLTRQHTGRHFVMIEQAADFAASLEKLPGEEFFVIEYLDARGGDGQARKYRVMFVDGKIYPLHLALSPNWKIHYFSADMSENAANRAEDERFLQDMSAAIGPIAMSALERIRDALGLDYGGVDFAVGAGGELLLFEANASMVVALPGADPRWDYRRPATQAILDAVRTMLLSRAAKGESAIRG